MYHMEQQTCRTNEKPVYEYLFNPSSIAVIGASADPLKPGGRVFKSIRENGYKGVLWPVNPNATEILGLPSFETIRTLPAAPDLAIVAIPSKLVLGAIEDLAKKGAKAVIVLTAGFGEKDETGKKAEQQMLSLAKAFGMAIIGPNCSGFMTPAYKGKFAGIVPDLPGRAVDMISGSGATVDYIMEMADGRGLSFGLVVNLGNSIQYGVEELLAMYDAQYGPDSARILLLYMESVRKPGLILSHGRSLIQKGCTIVAIKSGTTPAGQKAAASHTGAMAGSDIAVQALFDKAGIIRVRSKAEFIDTACALVACRGKLNGRNICVITDAGGPGVMMSDAIFRSGLTMAQFKDTTLKRMENILPPEATLTNPIDCLPSRNGDSIKAVIDTIAEEERDNVDAIAVLIGNSGMSDNAPIYGAIGKAMETCPIPVLPMFTSLATAGEKIDDFRKSGKVYFQDEVYLAAALGKICRPPLPDMFRPEILNYDPAAIEVILRDVRGAVSPGTLDHLMKAAGFRLPESNQILNRIDLRAACKKIGFPLVLKVMGLLHKTDVGGVRTGLLNEDAAETAFDDLMRIKGATGVIAQPMLDGIEMIVGASREEEFGHLIMFGLGGIYAEVLKDVSFALAPLSRAESLSMISRIKSVQILSGVRGQTGASVDEIADILQRLSRLVTDFPQIKEMDINPLKGHGEHLFAVDVRMVIDPYPG